MRTDFVVNTDDLDDERDAEAYTQYGLNLVEAVDLAYRPWLAGVVAARFGGIVPDWRAPAVSDAIESAAAVAHQLLTELAVADPTTPLSGPLERLRRSTSPVTEMLAAAELPAPPRDRVDIEMRPDDLYALGPMTFTDLSEQVHDAGIAWGAAKAYVHTRRSRASTTQADDATA